MGDSGCALVKRLALSLRMAANLAVIEDQRQRIGKKSDHGEHHQRGGLMNGGMFEVAVMGDGLKYFRVDSPAAATELMNEQRGDRPELEIGSVVIGALLRRRGLAFDPTAVLFPYRDAAAVFDADRFDDFDQAVGGRPVDLGQVPVSNFPVRL